MRRARRARAFQVDPETGEERSAAEQSKLWTAEQVRCRANPFYRFRQWAWIRNPKADDPDRRLIPLMMWPGQVRYVRFLLDGYLHGRDRVLNKGRELGATWLACLLIWHLWDSEPGFTALLGSRRESLVDDKTPASLFGKIRSAISTMPLPLRPRLDEAGGDKYLHLAHPETRSVISGESTNAGFARSDRQAVVLTDEFAHVQTALQQQVKLSLQTVARSWWAISTPKGRGNTFHLQWLTMDDRDKLELDWRTDPRRSPEWFDGLLTGQDGVVLTWDEREQEHACSFAGVSGERVLRADRDRVEYEDDDFDDMDRIRRSWAMVVAMDFGSGPSLTAAAYILVSWDMDGHPDPLMLLDRLQVWQRQPAAVVAQEIRDTLAESYGHNVYVVGDPAGVQAESDQESWESNLQSAGLPIRCLPAEYNGPGHIDEALKTLQRVLDQRRLLIHRKRAAMAMETVESWQWDIPASLPLELVNRAEIKPRKDVWSHPGDAMRYGVSVALRLRVDQQMESVIQSLPPTAGGEIADLYSRLLG